MNGRKWFSLALLSVIVPVSLLTTFKLTGIIPEPPNPETIEADAISWNMTRPSSTASFHGVTVENFYSDDIVPISLVVHVTTYLENDVSWGDSLWVRVNGTIRVQKGFIHSVCIRFSQTDENAFLSIHKIPPWPKTYNLNIADLVTFGSDTQRAYASAICVNQPKNSSLEVVVSWHFLDPNNISHWITASLETTYFNGTTYQRVITPIRLEVIST